MTSATYARVARRRVRIVAAAAGLVGALVLSGCSGDGSSDDSSDGSSPSASASAAPSGSGDADTGGSGGGTASPVSGLEGSWLATTDGDAVALMVTGDKAALFATGGTVCSGTVGEKIELACGDEKDNERASGTVDSVDAETLKVTWDSDLGTETYRKAEGATLPSGLPTAGLGQ
ncbi:hypothetical protein [Streptomyces sp. NPDC048002]|uniref:hypothetical protein n=1 Tax=Streptomyces sp. NPDC048002 TaxID=3154344 RepID=UPI0033DC9CC3